MFWFFFYKKYIKETLVYSPFTYQNKIKIAYAAIVKTLPNALQFEENVTKDSSICQKEYLEYGCFYMLQNDI